ncbi:VWA domain-containing protein [bacterium]|nr:VWA domain-containing protein [bacterium]
MELFWRLANPELLVLFAIIPVIIYYYCITFRQQSTSLTYSDIGLLTKLKPSPLLRWRHVLKVFRVLTLTALILALARPQSGMTEEEVLTHGVDIILALDISTSMMAEDLKPKFTRLDIAKEVIRDFIETRSNDRIGLVVFAARSFIQCPLTLDYGVLLSFLDQVDFAPKQWDGTAIGMAIANSVNRLRDSNAKSRIIILLTDGENNSGAIDPITGAQLAQATDIKIFTVGAGTNSGFAPIKVDDPFWGTSYRRIPVQIDEKTLSKIAELTGGQYHRATDASQLQQIYREISQMEKSEIEVKKYTEYTELFQYFLLTALCLFLIEQLLAHTRFRKLP